MNFDMLDCSIVFLITANVGYGYLYFLVFQASVLTQVALSQNSILSG